MVLAIDMIQVRLRISQYAIANIAIIPSLRNNRMLQRGKAEDHWDDFMFTAALAVPCAPYLLMQRRAVCDNLGLAKT